MPRPTMILLARLIAHVRAQYRLAALEDGGKLTKTTNTIRLVLVGAVYPGAPLSFLGALISATSILSLTLTSAGLQLRAPFSVALDQYGEYLATALTILTVPLDGVFQLTARLGLSDWLPVDSYIHLLPVPLLYMTRSVSSVFVFAGKRAFGFTENARPALLEDPVQNWWFAAIFRAFAVVLSLPPIIAASTLLSTSETTIPMFALAIGAPLGTLLIYAVLSGFGNAILLPGVERLDYGSTGFLPSLLGHLRALAVRLPTVGVLAILLSAILSQTDLPAQPVLVLLSTLLFNAVYMLIVEFRRFSPTDLSFSGLTMPLSVLCAFFWAAVAIALVVALGLTVPA